MSQYNAGLDQNSRATLTAISSVDGVTIVPLYANPITHRLLTDNSGSGGSSVWGSITGILSNQTDLQNALNAKQGTLTLTTTGTSGAATLVGNTLNIPQYSGGGSSLWTASGSNIYYNTGNVGIGTTTPATLLQTIGTPTLFSTNSVGIMSIGTPQKSGTWDSRLFFGIDNYTNFSIGQSYIQSREITQGTNTNLLLNPNGGGVGIGTSLADTALSVGSNGNAFLKLSNGSGFGGGSGATPYAGLSFQVAVPNYSTYQKGGIAFKTTETNAGYARGQIRFLLQPNASNVNAIDDVDNSTVMMLDYVSQNVTIGSTTVGSAKLNVTGTNEQMRLGYNASNYFSTTVSSTGSTTFDLAGTSPTFTFGKAISATNLSGTNTGDQTTITGNAGSATVLQTARTIAGQSFNGSTNIAIASTNLSDTASIALLTSTQTLTNKRITKRVLALSTNSATPAVNTDNYDVVHITAQTATITGFTMTGTPVDGDTLRISITGTATVPFTLGTSFEASTQPLGTTTSGTTRLDMGFIYNTETSKWRQVAQA